MAVSLKFPIYLDYHASTPVDPRALEAMLPYFSEHFGNAASKTHPFGWKADDAVEAGRRQVAALIGASAKEIVFTSGATESNNLALKGVAHAFRSRGNHIVTLTTEHKAVLDSCHHLEDEGFAVTYLGVGRDGLVDLDALRDAITDRTILVSVMTANNEIGVLQPIAAIGAIARERGVLVHTDAVQAVGKVPFDVSEAACRSGVDDRAQDVRAEGRRCAVRAPRRREAGARAVDGRRRSRAGAAIRHAQRARHRRLRESRRDREGGDGDRVAAARGPARPSARSPSRRGCPIFT